MKRKAPRSPAVAEPIGISLRADLWRAVALALVTVLIWCGLFNRWTAESWNTPLEYLESVETGDVIGVLAGIKAASEGQMMPLLFNNVPQLGAPGVGNWNDYPTPERPIFLLAGALAHVVGLFAAANLVVLIAFVLSAVAFYAAARLLDCSWVWSFAGALIFAFARYAFGHGLHHVTVLYDAQVPLDLVVVEWVFRGEGLEPRGRRFVIALAVAFATGLLNIYYTYLFAQLLLFGGLYQAWRGGWRRAVPAGLAISFAALAVVLMNLNTMVYHLAYGQGRAIDRPYQWLEAYGLKLVDLVVPPPDHPFPPFADWGEHHLHEVLLSAGEQPTTGYLGLVGLAALAWLVLVSLRAAVERQALPLATYLILWIIIFAGVGAVNGVLGTLGFTLIRSTTRYSIVILALVLLFAARRLSGWKQWKSGAPAYFAAFLAAVLAIWDQSPPFLSDADLRATQAQVASDHDFVAAMARALPTGAMVFQLPVMDFPESPAPGVGAYDHLRPYLYTSDLRFSFGSDKGRSDTDWQHEMMQLPVSAIILKLIANGFSAIYVNRHGFSDQGQAIINAAKADGYGQIIQSEDGTLFCIPLTTR